MRAAIPATISLIASGALHVLLVVALARSASGAERQTDELDPARFVGNTFEIETVDAAAVATGFAPATPPAPAVPLEAATPPAPAPTPAEPVEKPLSPPAAPTTDSEQVEPKPAPASTLAPPAGAESAVAAPPAPPPERPPLAPSPGTPATDGAQGATTGVVSPSYGQDALPASTASLAKAFTRAVPRIASSDKVWHGLPMGAAGKAVFSIEVDAQGKVVGQGRVLEEPAPAPHLERIIGRTVLLLRSQTFGVSAVQRFELSAEIRQVAALEDAFAEPQDLRQIGRLVEPTLVRPGKANFTYNSGRQVELTLRLLAE